MSRWLLVPNQRPSLPTISKAKTGPEMAMTALRTTFTTRFAALSAIGAGHTKIARHSLSPLPSVVGLRFQSNESSPDGNRGLELVHERTAFLGNLGPKYGNKVIREFFGDLSAKISWCLGFSVYRKPCQVNRLTCFFLTARVFVKHDDKRQGFGLGFGFVEFETIADMNKAVREFDGKVCPSRSETCCLHQCLIFGCL